MTIVAFTRWTCEWCGAKAETEGQYRWDGEGVPEGWLNGTTNLVPLLCANCHNALLAVRAQRMPA
jgi:hypothetical protein